MKTILFQGDSITDTCRKDEYICHLGMGYPLLVASRLGLDRPNCYSFFNRGVSGYRIVYIYAQIKRDIINLKPDVMSLLIGVNDVWHELDSKNGVDTPKFKKIYKMLLDEILTALPGIKIILMEPFVLKGQYTKPFYEAFRAQVKEKAIAVRQIAEEYQLPFISLQEELKALTKFAPAEYWLLDGVHPNFYFHQYIADRWIETFTAAESKYCVK